MRHYAVLPQSPSESTKLTTIQEGLDQQNTLTPEEFEKYIQANVNAENELANTGVASSSHVMLKPVHQSISHEQSNHLTSGGLGSYEQSHQQSQKMSNRYISADKADSNRDEGRATSTM